MKNAHAHGSARSVSLRLRLAQGTLAVLSAALWTNPASAQDTVDFSGFHLEALAGWDNTGVNFDDNVFDEGRTSQDGFFYGVAGGYDFQFGDLVAGAEIELSDSSAGKHDVISGTTPGGSAITSDVEVDVGNDFYIGLRGGGRVMPNLLLYGKAGYTHSSIQANGSGLEDEVPFSFDNDIDIDGFRIGAGAEYVFPGNIYGKVEYRYSNYNNGELDVAGPDPDLNTLFDKIDIDRHQVVVGVGYRF